MLETEIYQSKEIHPSILYYGTPVILLCTLNEDGTTNISPLSSSWALEDRIVIGCSVDGKAYENLCHHRACVINVPDPALWENVEKLASLTGKKAMPEWKRAAGFHYKKDKFTTAGLTAEPSKIVKPARIKESPLQIEATVQHIQVSSGESFAIIETQAVCIHAHHRIAIGNKYIDPAKWNPLIYNFRHYFSLGAELGKTFRAESKPDTP